MDGLVKFSRFELRGEEEVTGSYFVLFNEHLSHKGSLFSSGNMSADFAVMSDH